MNDNIMPSKREMMIANLLKHTASIIAHLNEGLPVFLREAGVDPKIREGIEGFVIRPVTALVEAIEIDVIKFARKDAVRGMEPKGKDFDLEM